MSIPAGPFQYTSPHKPIPHSEDEEAALAFAACGVTGYALAILTQFLLAGAFILLLNWRLQRRNFPFNRALA